MKYLTQLLPALGLSLPALVAGTVRADTFFCRKLEWFAARGGSSRAVFTS